MTLDVKIYSGAARTWNVVHSADKAIYSSIEFEGGKKIGDLQITPELNEMFEPALRQGQELNLHVVKPLQEGPATIIAFEEPEGKIFATDVPPLPLLLSLAPRLALVVGVLLIPAFGLGILILGAWSTMRSRIRPLVELREYVQRLPRAILVKS